MLQIATSQDVPDSTYFRVGSAEPELKGDVLELVDGSGQRRSSWGAPGVTSTVILNTDDLVAVHVGFHHKHGGGQFWRYYRVTGGEWQQAIWAQLIDADRVRVLNAYEDHAPSWAKIPGKVRTSYKRPESVILTTYKIVEIVDGRYFSVYDGNTEYVLGKRMAEKAVSEHGGGYYSYPTREGVEARFADGSLFPRDCYDEPMRLALIECEISGTILDYDGKYASTYLRPVRELKQSSYAPSLQEAS